MNMMKIGRNLSAIRMQRGLTQEELAEAIGVTNSHIAHVENGSSGISLELILKICRTLRTTPNDILAGEHETEEKSDGHALSSDRLRPSDRELLRRIAHFIEHRDEIWP